MKKSFFNDFFRIVPANMGGFLVLLSWTLYTANPHPAIMIVFSIFTVFWGVWLICMIWTGRLTRITVYADRIKWHRHLKSRIIPIDDIKIIDVVPVKHMQWCRVVIDDNGSELHIGLTNSRHMAKLLSILQPSKFTDVLKEEKKKCDDWGFNSSI